MQETIFLGVKWNVATIEDLQIVQDFLYDDGTQREYVSIPRK